MASDPVERSCCACLRVSMRAIEHSDGTMSDEWRCQLCDAEFARRKPFTDEIERLREENVELVASRNHHRGKAAQARNARNKKDADNRALREKLPLAWTKGAAHGYKVGKYGHENNSAVQCDADLRELDTPDADEEKRNDEG